MHTTFHGGGDAVAGWSVLLLLPVLLDGGKERSFLSLYRLVIFPPFNKEIPRMTVWIEGRSSERVQVPSLLKAQS